MQRLSLQDREPDFHLVEPRGPRRREVEPDVRVTLEPAVVPGLVSVEVVEDDVDGRVRMGGDDIDHEVEEFDPTPALLVSRRYLAVATSKAANSVEALVLSLCLGGGLFRQSATPDNLTHLGGKIGWNRRSGARSRWRGRRSCNTSPIPHLSPIEAIADKKAACGAASRALAEAPVMA